MAAILVLFFDLLSCPLCVPFLIGLPKVLTCLFFTFMRKRKNTTVTFFLKFMSIFLKSLHFLAHLVYQPKSLIQSCFVHHHWCWHHWHWHLLCTPHPGIGLDIETSYLVYTCTYVPHICTLNILSF